MALGGSLLAILASTLLVSALALSLNWDAEIWAPEGSSLSVNELCNEVGRNSGCSGCQLGTKNLCTWMAQHSTGVTKRVFEDGDTEYYCKPTADVTSLLDSETEDWSVASELCPANPAKEPIVRQRVNGAEAEFERSSVVHSSWFTSALASFPVQPWPVDRFSFYGPFGAAVTDWGDTDAASRIDCAHLLTHELVDLQYEEPQDDSVEESTLFNGYLLTERDKFCVRVGLAAFIATRCPEYGVPVSGICKSFYEKIVNNCGDGKAHLGPNSGHNSNSKAMESLYVVPDDTAYCLDSFRVEASGELEHLAGLDIPVSKLQEMYDDGEAFEYDWPAFHSP